MESEKWVGGTHLVLLGMLEILPVTVMLMAWLLSLYLDSHQYTPLADVLTDVSWQPEEVRMPQSDPHCDKRSPELEEMQTFCHY